MMTSREYLRRIRAIAKAEGMRIGDIETECGVARGYISRATNHNAFKYGISLELAQKLAEATGHTFIDVFTKDIAKELELSEVRKELRELEERTNDLKKLLQESEAGIELQGGV